MGIKDFFLRKKGGGGEEVFRCEKCGKEKKKSQGMFILGGSAFCCKVCCGDPEKGEHRAKKNNVCEFC